MKSILTVPKKRVAVICLEEFHHLVNELFCNWRIQVSSQFKASQAGWDCGSKKLESIEMSPTRVH